MDLNNDSNCVRTNENTQDHLEGQRMSLESEEEIRARTRGLVGRYFESPCETISIEEELPGNGSVRPSTPPPTYAQVIVGENGNPPELNARDLEACKRGLDSLKCDKIRFYQEVMKNVTLIDKNNVKMNVCHLGLTLIQICAVLYLYIWCRAIERRVE